MQKKVGISCESHQWFIYKRFLITVALSEESNINKLQCVHYPRRSMDGTSVTTVPDVWRWTVWTRFALLVRLERVSNHQVFFPGRSRMEELRV